MLEMIEKAFSQELLVISPNASRIVDFTWVVYNIGGTVPVSAISEQFQEAKEYVSILSKAGILRYALGGFINKNQRKESLSVSLNEELGNLISKGTKRKEFESIIFRNYGVKLIPYCRSGLTEPIAVMLTSIIFYATPNRPVFVNTVVRKAAKVCMKNHIECKNILDYYLHKFLGLITFESASMINLSVRSKQRVRAYPKIWEMYMREYKERPKEVIPKPEPRKVVESKVSEQEKKLRGYFPWLKL